MHDFQNQKKKNTHFNDSLTYTHKFIITVFVFFLYVYNLTLFFDKYIKALFNKLYVASNLWHLLTKSFFFFFFLEKQTHTDIREREMGSNTKAHHNSTQKVMVTQKPWKGVLTKSYLI